MDEFNKFNKVVEVNSSSERFERRTGPRYNIQNDHVSAMQAILSSQTFGGHAPNAEGIVEPEAVVEAPIASHTFSMR